MPCIFLTVLLAAALSPTQTQPSTQTGPAPTTAKSSSVASAKTERTSPASGTNSDAAIAPSDAVITIHGQCAITDGRKSTLEAKCDTVVTRQQFDAVVTGLSAISTSLLPVQRRAVAEGYAKTLVNYEAAKKAGVEKDPRFAEVLRLARMRAMGDMYNTLLQERARKVSSQEIHAYYTSNTDKFEELTLRRVTLPRYNTANLKDEAFAAKARSVASDIHDRAVQGEDIDKLEKEAFASLGLKDPPTTHMGVVRRGIFVDEQEKQLFALKPGEVTGVFEQASAFIIFKLEGRETPSLDKSKDEIVRLLVQHNLEKQEAENSSAQIDYNEQYLGPSQTSAWMPASHLNSSRSDSKKPAAKSESPK